MRTLSRRKILAAASAAPVALTMGEAGAAAAKPISFSTPAEHVRAFLKLNASLENKTIFHTYTGTLEALMPGREIVNLCACTSIVRRQVEVKDNGHLVSIWEATVYHRPGETVPLNEFVNPLNGRTVQPFHQREGRGQSLWTDQGPQFLRSDGVWTSRYTPEKPFTLEWRQAGDFVWVERYSSGVYLKNPLTKEQWPLEHSGPDLLYSEKTTNGGLAKDVQDPNVKTVARATYDMNVTMLWWPWLLMGQTPGFCVWNTHGVKALSADDIPASTRKLVEAVHPTILKADGMPWEGRFSLWADYPIQRKPVSP